MSKISLALAAALLAGGGLVTTAEARGCGGYGGGFYSQSYSSPSYNGAARRQAIARAKAQQAAKARALAAREEKKPLKVAKIETSSTATAVAPAIVVPGTPAKADVAQAKSQITTAALTPTNGTVKAAVNDTDKQVVIKKADAAADAKQICRKFSAATGGLVEVACE